MPDVYPSKSFQSDGFKGQRSPLVSHGTEQRRSRSPDAVIAALKEKDVFVNISYPWPIHTMKGYEYLGYKQGDLPHTELAATQIFSLPMYPALNSEQQEYTIDVLKTIAQSLD